MLSFSAILDPDPETGSYTVTFPNVPEAVTQGDTEEEALAMGRDCLLTVFGEYIRRGRRIPRPSARQGRRRRSVVLPLLASIKLELFNAWIDSGITKSELARRLRIPKTVIDRLFDLKHRSRMEQIEEAFRVLGKHLDIAVREAA